MQSLTERMLLCAARLNPHIAVEVEKFVPEVRQLETDNAELIKTNEELKADNDRLLESQESLAWNLAGCSVFASGHDINEPYAEHIASPALKEVRKLAQEYAELALKVRQLEAFRSAIEEVTPMRAGTAYDVKSCVWKWANKRMQETT